MRNVTITALRAASYKNTESIVRFVNSASRKLHDRHFGR